MSIKADVLLRRYVTDFHAVALREKEAPYLLEKGTPMLNMFRHSSVSQKDEI